MLPKSAAAYMIPDFLCQESLFMATNFRAQWVHQLFHRPTQGQNHLHTQARPAGRQAREKQWEPLFHPVSLASPRSFHQEKQIVITNPSLLFPLLLSGSRKCSLLANYEPLTVHTTHYQPKLPNQINGPCYNQRRNISGMPLLSPDP